mmetsp:Transcript_25027/g.54624  ORF Transcript_25027/g.54624 Transcript_25027/m.54624 type:complete len:202 (+) Transcript_25027:1711-2316(+)
MNCTDADRSDWLNSYGTLKPSGPNLRRSCTIVCMKQSEKSITRHCGCVFESSMSWLIQAYEPLRPALMPAGASLVTLIDICSSPIGNLGCGSAVIHKRKESTISASSLISHCSTSIMKPMPRWQFWSTTQSPEAMAVDNSLRAAGSCPWPSEIIRTWRLRFLARSQIRLVGSEPMESSAMMGTRSLASSTVTARSSGREST